LRAKANHAAEPILKAILDNNLSKLKVLTAAQLMAVIVSLSATTDLEFPDDKLRLLSSEQLQSGMEKLKAAVSSKYEAFCNGYDPRSLPADYRVLLDTAFNAEFELVKARAERYWKLWVADIFIKELDKLSLSLAKLASDTKVGDDRVWDTGVLASTTSANMTFEATLRATYLRPDLDDQVRLFQSAVDVTSATQAATWNQNESDVKNQLRKTLLAAQTAYTTRLADSILDTTKQPLPVMFITPVVTEMVFIITQYKLEAG
jgi:hypothetical protein